MKDDAVEEKTSLCLLRSRREKPSTYDDASRTGFHASTLDVPYKLQSDINLKSSSPSRGIGYLTAINDGVQQWGLRHIAWQRQRLLYSVLGAYRRLERGWWRRVALYNLSERCPSKHPTVRKLRAGPAVFLPRTFSSWPARRSSISSRFCSLVQMPIEKRAKEKNRYVSHTCRRGLAERSLGSECTCTPSESTAKQSM